MQDPLAVLLSGEHPTLPPAELRALLDVHDPKARVEAYGRVAVVHPARRQASEAAIRRMALGHEWGTLWDDGADNSLGLQALAAALAAKAPGTGSAAVAATRIGTARTVSRSDAEQSLGAALAQAGHRIDLKRPDLTVFAWVGDGRIRVGARGGVLDRSSHESRTSDDRSHFSPVSMHPRRAASLVHLARVRPGGRILDPFCGTGALVLEAALAGYDAWGSDLDRFMVQGTMTTLADAGPEPLDGTVFKADICEVPDLVGQVDGIVTDFPYGRASSSHDEGLAQLYGRAFAAFARVLPPGGHAVVGCAQPGLLPPLADHGFVDVERHAERVHKSLTRHFVVARRA